MVLIFRYLFHGVFFEKNIFALRKILGQLLFRELFILFTGILLKSRVYLHHTPHYLKAGFVVLFDVAVGKLFAPMNVRV